MCDVYPSVYRTTELLRLYSCHISILYSLTMEMLKTKCQL